MRFLLIDRITDLVPHKSISAVKNLTLAEEYLADHFPGFPVMPGVMMLETLVQAGAWLIRHSEDFAQSVILLKEVRAIRYNNFVSPGNTLKVELTVRKQDGRLWDFNGTGTVNGQSAVNARLTLEAQNLADRNPELQTSDSARRETYRKLFQQIWVPVA
jgi:3-hydroxyacyl-[acyl-carrier-protein] dehydratase